MNTNIEVLTVLSFCSLLTSFGTFWYTAKSLRSVTSDTKNILQKLNDKNVTEEDLNSRLEQLQRMKFSPMRSRIER